MFLFFWIAKYFQFFVQLFLRMVFIEGKCINDRFFNIHGCTLLSSSFHIRVELLLEKISS